MKTYQRADGSPIIQASSETSKRIVIGNREEKQKARRVNNEIRVRAARVEAMKTTKADPSRTANNHPRGFNIDDAAKVIISSKAPKARIIHRKINTTVKITYK